MVNAKLNLSSVVDSFLVLMVTKLTDAHIPEQTLAYRYHNLHLQHGYC